MAMKGIKQAKSNTVRLFQRIAGPVTEQTMQAVLYTGASYAAALTPVDTSLLINSQYTEIEKTPNGFLGRVGYTAEYARFVHEMSGKLKGQPRSSVESFETSDGRVGFESNSGNFWDPNAEPQFLKKGFERDGADEIKQIIERSYRL